MKTAASSPSAPRRWADRGFITLGVVLLVAAAHLSLIDLFGSDQPFHDQWLAEGFVLFRPWLHHELTWHDFFLSHSEHHPALTRLLAFAEFVVNGQWDARVEMLFNVALIAATAGALCEFARRLLPARLFAAVSVPVVVMFALPSNYENTLWGFQSQFYFMLLFGALHVLMAGRGRLDRWWVLGQTAGFLALFSIAAGVASSVALAGLAAVQLVRGPRNRWAWTTATAGVLYTVYAWWLLPPMALAPGLHARSIGEFLLTFFYLAIWPSASLPGLVLVVPGLWLLVRALIRPARAPFEGALIALVLWSFLTEAGIAYGRGTTPGIIAGRYLDVLSVAIVANAFALAHGIARRPAWPRTGAVFAIGWVVVLSMGCWRGEDPGFLKFAFGQQRDHAARQQIAVRGFLATDDETWLTRDPEVKKYLPHFEPTKAVLRDPPLRRRLAPSIMPPLVCVRDPRRSQGFENREENGAIGSGAGVSRIDQRYVSEPLDRVGLSRLRFRVRGEMGANKSELLLEDASGGWLRPLGDPAGETGFWHTVNFAVPPGPVRIVARTPVGAEGLAFSAPIEVGRLSWLAPKVIAPWPWVAGLGMIFLGVGAWKIQAPRGRSG